MEILTSASTVDIVICNINSIGHLTFFHVSRIMILLVLCWWDCGVHAIDLVILED